MIAICRMQRTTTSHMHNVCMRNANLMQRSRDFCVYVVAHKLSFMLPIYCMYSPICSVAMAQVFGLGSWFVTSASNLVCCTFSIKMQAAFERNRLEGTNSHFALLLQNLCVWGEISWNAGQRLAYAAQLDADEFDFGIHPLVSAFAKLGTSGIYTGNVRRDAMKTFKISNGLSAALQVRLPYKLTKAVGKSRLQEAEFPIILPSVLFEDLFRNFQRKFVSMLGQGVRKFWESLKPNDPCDGVAF